VKLCITWRIVFYGFNIYFIQYGTYIIVLEVRNIVKSADFVSGAAFKVLAGKRVFYFPFCNPADACPFGVHKINLELVWIVLTELDVNSSLNGKEIDCMAGQRVRRLLKLNTSTPTERIPDIKACLNILAELAWWNYNNLGTLFEYGTVCRAKPCCNSGICQR